MPHADVSFESFVRGPASERGYRLCRAVARSSRAAPHVVLLHGATGTGKTHLLRATARMFRAVHPGRSVVLTTAVDLRHSLVEAIRQRFDAVDQRFDAVDQRVDETRRQLTELIEDVRDDVRIVLEGQVALEKRVSKLERRPR